MSSDTHVYARETRAYVPDAYVFGSVLSWMSLRRPPWHCHSMMTNQLRPISARSGSTESQSIYCWEGSSWVKLRWYCCLTRLSKLIHPHLGLLSLTRTRSESSYCIIPLAILEYNFQKPEYALPCSIWEYDIVESDPSPEDAILWSGMHGLIQNLKGNVIESKHMLLCINLGINIVKPGAPSTYSFTSTWNATLSNWHAYFDA